MRQPLSFTFRDRKLICSIVLIGTYLIIGVITVLLLVSLSLNHAHALVRLAVCGIAFLYIAIIQLLARLNRHRIVAYLLVLFYMVLATGIVWSWGINTPIGLLIFGLTIVLAGILLTARHAIFAVLATAAILGTMQTVIFSGWHTPDIVGTGSPSSFGDVFAYCTVFGMLALISWLYNREMEHSLAHAKQAEVALQQQKATLEIQVEERTEELRHAQLEEMHHMYRFAELGQLGVTLLHDLANHLTTLTLEIEGIRGKEHTKTIARAQQIVQYLGDIVARTRDRLHGDTQEQTFNIIRKVSEVVAFLHYKAAKAHVTIDWQPPGRSWLYKGDPDSLSQVIAIITNNAVDAYNASPDIPSQQRRVMVTMRRDNTQIIVQISDRGKGISENEREHLFKPTHSTKKSGLGLGLFIAKQIIEMEFSGTIELSPSSESTEFIITLPLLNHE